MDYVYGAHDVGCELGADLVFVLVFAGADDAWGGGVITWERGGWGGGKELRKKIYHTISSTTTPINKPTTSHHITSHSHRGQKKIHT